MAESTLHKELVICMANYVEESYSNTIIVTDLQEKPGDDIPPDIGGHRPDLYATTTISPDLFRANKSDDLIGKQKHYIIGEAKTPGDLKTKRSEKQISSFLSFLNEQKVSSFILSVPFNSAVEAKSRLNSLYKELNLSLNDCVVFDQICAWKLKDKDTSWHLI